jgi:hypothetical protein
MKSGYTVFTTTNIENKNCIEVINYPSNNEVVNIFWSSYIYLKSLRNKYSVGVWKIKKK